MLTTRCRVIASFRGLRAEERWTITYKCFVKNVTTIEAINDNHCRRSISGSFLRHAFAYVLSYTGPYPYRVRFLSAKYILSRPTAKPYWMYHKNKRNRRRKKEWKTNNENATNGKSVIRQNMFSCVKSCRGNAKTQVMLWRIKRKKGKKYEW